MDEAPRQQTPAAAQAAAAAVPADERIGTELAEAAEDQLELPDEAAAPSPLTTPGGSGYFVRRVHAAAEFELFFVSAVGTILIVRAALALTGWPQLGGGKIHFAHLLWGGLGMLIGIVLFMAFQGRLWRFLATLACGIGFGLFIDELGKFITSDNDYFFQPVIALIYLIFVGLFFLFHWLGTVRNLTQQVALVNAFDYAKEAVLRNMDAGERDAALYLLSRSDTRDPIVISLTETLRTYTDLVQPLPSPVTKVRGWLARIYSRLLRSRVFKVLMVGWFLVVALANLIAFVPSLIDSQGLTFANVGLALSGALSGALVVIGVIRWRRSRLSAYRWFERGVLVAIFIGCFFSFYQDQLAALWDLLVLLVTWATIRYIIGEELKRQAGERAAATQTSGGDHGTPQGFAEGGD
jgi:hypothetical protein